jgi:hypothetical protein
MIQIILLICGVVALVRLPRLHKLRAADQPEVDAEAFGKWRAAELWAAYWLIAATWGVLILQFVAGFVMGVVLGIMRRTRGGSFDTGIEIITFGGLGLFVLLLVVAAVYGSKAKRLKEAGNIRWPQKG